MPQNVVLATSNNADNKRTNRTTTERVDTTMEQVDTTIEQADTTIEQVDTTTEQVDTIQISESNRHDELYDARRQLCKYLLN